MSSRGLRHYWTFGPEGFNASRRVSCLKHTCICQSSALKNVRHGLKMFAGALDAPRHCVWHAHYRNSLQSLQMKS